MSTCTCTPQLIHVHVPFVVNKGVNSFISDYKLIKTNLNEY